jgi:DNA primase
MNILNTAVAEPYDTDAVTQSLINHGKAIMNTQSQITCDTTEEWTEERKQAFEKASAYEPPSTTLINPSVDTQSTNQPVQGVSGAVYAPMDTSPQPQDKNQRVAMLMDMLTATLNSLVKELQTPTQPQTDLEDAVNTALEQAQWFKDFVEETCAEKVGDLDFEYELDRAVENEMRNFDPNDYIDFDDLVSSAVSDHIDDAVNSALDDRLETLLEEKLANARITINF